MNNCKRIPQKDRSLITTVVLCLLFCCLLFTTTQAQSPFPNARDDNYPLLGLKRAKSNYEKAQNELKRLEELYRKDLISRQTYEEAETAFAEAEVNYQQSLLVLLFEQQFVSIANAVKYQDENGNRRVKITLENTSGTSAELAQIVQAEDEIFRSLQPDRIHNIYVSVSNDDGAIISNPYEVKINELRAGTPETVDFELLQDLDEVTVNIIYGDGSSRNPKIFLQKDETANKVLLQSEQFAQEVELGESASYDLSLELFSGVDNTYKLEVVNLPQSVNRYFSDPNSSARMSQIKFSESTNTRNANLEVFLPDRPSDELQMDVPLTFYVLAIPRDRLPEFDSKRSETWTPEQIEDFNVGFVRLEMTPRGLGRLVVRAPQLYNASKAGEVIEFNTQVVNEGTRPLNNVEFELDTPFEWEKRVEPAVIPSLGIREEQTVMLYLIPPDNISVGKYETRLRTTSLSDNQPVNADDKVFTVEIAAEANITGTAILLFLILGLVGGLVYFGIKLSKK